MGPVTQTLVNILRHQVETHGTVVWFDLKGTYLDATHSLAQQRLGGFWSAHSPEIKTRWQVIIVAGRPGVSVRRSKAVGDGMVECDDCRDASIVP